jgi:hypothetical protein
MTINDYRQAYRDHMNTAKAHGWSAEEFNTRCNTLAAWRLDRYANMTRPEAFMLAAQEVVNEEIHEAADA